MDSRQRVAARILGRWIIFATAGFGAVSPVVGAAIAVDGAAIAVDGAAIAVDGAAIVVDGADGPDAHQPLFDSDAVLPLTISLPFRRGINNDRLGEAEYHPGEVSYLDADAGRVALEVEIRTRGKTRRRKKICDMPPLRLRFDTPTVAGTLFESQRALKLVTHCQDKNSFDQHVLLEYLAYRIQNLLTEYGQRVRLLKVTYVDNARPFATRNGILLENWRRVAKRTGTQDADVDGAVRMESLSVPDVNRIAVFNYLIGNEDWTVLWPEPKENCCHNTKPLFTKAGTVIPMLYDFDYSGLVDAPYAMAKPPNNDVRRRRYRGLCHTQGSVEETLQEFRDKREVIYELVRNIDGLRASKVKSTLKYFDRFYDVINDPEQVQRKLIRACKVE